MVKVPAYMVLFRTPDNDRCIILDFKPTREEVVEVYKEIFPDYQGDKKHQDCLAHLWQRDYSCTEIILFKK